MNLFIAALSVLLVASACKKVGSEGYGTTKHTIETSLKSLNITDVNHHVASSVIAVIADTSTNRAVVTHYGKVVDATNILTGKPTAENDDNDNKGATLTALGVFTIHALEYCPPWLSGRKHHPETLPCNPENPLGEYGLWFKDGYIFGIHGRPSEYQDQFYATYRKISQGCLVFPEGSLTKLVDLIFSTLNFQGSKAVETIKQYRAVRRNTNVAIRIRDSFKQQLSEELYPSEIGNPLAVDVKLVVVNMAKWDPPDISQQGLVKLLEGTPHEGHLQLVQDCELTHPSPLYKFDHMSDSPHEILGTAAAQIFQRLPAMSRTRQRVFVSATLEEKDSLSSDTPLPKGSPAQILGNNPFGWVDVSPLKCDGPYYWSQNPTQPNP